MKLFHPELLISNNLIMPLNLYVYVYVIKFRSMSKWDIVSCLHLFQVQFSLSPHVNLEIEFVGLLE
jgi:hypothetical protein